MNTKKLPPDPERMNDARADWAAGAVNVFMAETGTEECDALADLVCDLMHFCDRNAESYGTFAEALRRAQSNYADETYRDPDCADTPVPDDGDGLHAFNANGVCMQCGIKDKRS